MDQAVSVFEKNFPVKFFGKLKIEQTIDFIFSGIDKIREIRSVQDLFPVLFKALVP